MEFEGLLRVIAAFSFVLLLILFVAWVVRKLGLDKKFNAEGKTSGSLKIEESLYIDAKRRLMIISASDQKHLLLLSPYGDKFLPLDNGGKDEK